MLVFFWVKSYTLCYITAIVHRAIQSVRAFSSLSSVGNRDAPVPLSFLHLFWPQSCVVRVSEELQDEMHHHFWVSGTKWRAAPKTTGVSDEASPCPTRCRITINLNIAAIQYSTGSCRFVVHSHLPFFSGPETATSHLNNCYLSLALRAARLCAHVPYCTL